ncbi:hypothetical protein K469DRAFT_82745 [Zopfia rhizophila CBS 207.26]|uniref:Uncharacterized protein n=1 Tax=Zopfia rhizophila CBS 207.26 TaxID=1314779 RepID=A0A6A6EDA2_9PEZI|nr:hypothetical protein K469DRAFT_82745 [Zopfia rhizophila CBS 207.26]
MDPKNHVEGDNPPQTASQAPFVPEPDEILQIKTECSARSPLVFGYGGNYAHTDPFGLLLQINGYLPQQNALKTVEMASTTGYGQDDLDLKKRLERFEVNMDAHYGVGLFPYYGWSYLSEWKRKSVEWLFNRWPQISFDIGDEFAITVRLFVSDGLIVQQYAIKNLTGKKREITFACNLKLNARSHFGGNKSNDEHQDVDSIYFDAEANPMLRCAQEGLRLRLSLYRNQAKLTLSSRTDPYENPGKIRTSYLLDTEFPVSVSLEPEATNELTAIYQLQDLDTMPREDFVLPYVSADEFLMAERLKYTSLDEKSPGKPGDEKIPDEKRHDAKHHMQAEPDISPDQHKYHACKPPSLWAQNFFRRHLEHILSVCALPVPGRLGERNGLVFIDSYLASSSISTFGNFYSFRFLLGMFTFLGRYLINKSCNIYQRRIKDACIQHLEWTFHTAQVDKDGAWLVGYLPTGEGSQDQPKSSFTAGSLNHLKLFEFLEVFPDQADRVAGWINERTVSWLKALQSTRHKQKLWFDSTITLDIEFRDLTFRPSNTLDVPKYKLTRLVILWLALRKMREKIREKNIKEALGQIDEGLPDDIEKEIYTVKFDNLKREILTAFTVDQDVLENMEMRKEKMDDQRASTQTVGLPGNPNDSATAKRRLVFSRTADTDEIRTIFYSNDTFLFEAADFGFFQDDRESELEIWREVVKHHANLDITSTIWPKTSFYALRLAMLGCRRMQDWRFPGLDLADQLSKVRRLLQEVVLESGIIAADIDLDTRKPSWHLIDTVIPFQIPTILLWDECVKCSPTSKVIPASMQLFTNPLLPAQSLAQYRAALSGDDKHIAPSSSAVSADQKLVKKLKIGSAKIDSKNIINGREFSRDWLYDYPSFFHSEPITYDRVEQTKDLGVPFFERALDSWDRSEEEMRPKEEIVVVVDVATKRPSNTSDGTSTKELKGKTMDNINVIVAGGSALEDYLKAARTPEQAKKRFIFLEHCPKINSLSVCLAAPGRDPQERKRLATFFLSLSKGKSLHEEWLHRSGNLWESEFHLYFFQIVGEDEISDPHREGILNINPMSFPGSEGTTKRSIIRTGAGYRFVGDLYDRFWTCYFASLVVHVTDNRWITADAAEHSHWPPANDRQDQRRVLELYLAEKMTDVASDSGQAILDAIDKTLEKSGTLDNANPYSDDFDAQFSRSAIFQRISQLLHKLENNYKEMLDVIGQWEKRQGDRSVQPRWTEKDERRCRKIMDHHDRRVRKNINLLKSQKSTIDSLLTLVNNQGDTFKNDFQLLMSNLQLEEARRSTRLSQDVRLFTYVTIVFLPLSFSSSIFSMGGAPDHKTVGIMVATTSVALAITLLLLANMKLMDRQVRIAYRKFEGASRKMMKNADSTWLVDWKSKAEALQVESADTGDKKEDNTSRRSSTSDEDDDSGTSGTPEPPVVKIGPGTKKQTENRTEYEKRERDVFEAISNPSIVLPKCRDKLLRRTRTMSAGETQPPEQSKSPSPPPLAPLPEDIEKSSDESQGNEAPQKKATEKSDIEAQVHENPQGEKAGTGVLQTLRRFMGFGRAE